MAFRQPGLITMQLSHVWTLKALKGHTFMSANGMRYSGLSSSTGNCLWTGYTDCASMGLFVDRIHWLVHQQNCLWTGYADCASVELFMDRICWLLHQWNCLWTGYTDCASVELFMDRILWLCISGTVYGQDTLTVHQWNCLWTGYTDCASVELFVDRVHWLCISGTVCGQDTLTVHQWDCLWTRYADCINGTVRGQDMLTVRQWDCLWTGYAECINGTVCGQDTLTCTSVGLLSRRTWCFFKCCNMFILICDAWGFNCTCLIFCNLADPIRILNSCRNDHIVQDWWNVLMVHTQIVYKFSRNSFACAWKF